MTRTTLLMPDTPVGPLLLAAVDGALTEIRFDPAEAAAGDVPEAADGVLADAAAQLREYFAGTRHGFELPIAFATGTPFQQRVWTTLREIPYGRTWSYGELARRVGTSAGPRAVGAANGQNPLPVVVPCHRVIGSDGKLVGYGGGLPRKRTLLDLESQVAALPLS